MTSPTSADAVESGIRLTSDTSPSESTADPPPWGQTGRQLSARDRLGLAIFAVGSIGAGGWLMILGRGLTFFYDEWNWVDSRGVSFWTSDLAPHNGHPVVVPFAIYRLTLAVAGIRHYWPYLLLVVAVNILCGWLLFVLLRRKIHPVIAASVATVLMVLGPAWQDLLWPFQIGFLGSMAGGLGALILLDRRQPGADATALACLLVAVFSSGIGLTMVAGITVELLWRRRDWRRIWIPLASAAAFAIWDLTKARGSSSLVAASATAGARYIGQSAAGAVGALVGRDTTVGSILAIALAIFVIVAMFNRTSECGRLAMAVVGGLTFWLLTLVTRGSDPTASRYLYPGAIFVLLAIGELPGLLKARRTPNARHTRDGALMATVTGIVIPLLVVAYCGAAIWWNSSVLRSGRGGLLSVAIIVRAELTGVQLESRALSLGFRPDAVDMPQMETGAYLAAVDAYGSPADSPTSLARQSASVRASVDAMLLRGLPMRVSLVPSGQAPTGVCHTHAFGQTIGVQLPASGVWISAPPGSPVQVTAHAFSATPSQVDRRTIPAGRTARVVWSGKGTTITWQLVLTSPRGPTVTCMT